MSLSVRSTADPADHVLDPLKISKGKFAECARSLQVHESVIRAVAQVESAGSGFIEQSKPKVLFERHAFHRLTGGRFDQYENLSHPTWDKSQYSRTSAGEWERLEAACRLDRAAALQSASWGMFQIMGFNYSYCGMFDVEAFVAAQCESADRQLELFARFIARPPFLSALRDIKEEGDNEASWTKFAVAYNGKGHAKNRYVPKLQQAHDRWREELRIRPVGASGSADGSELEEWPVAKVEEGPIGRVEFAAIHTTRRRTPGRRRNVRPDPVDLRDWEYQPNISIAPSAWVLPNNPRPTKAQGDTNACTGFALATVIEYLLAKSDRPVEPISGYMLYDMARRYDEWAQPKPDEEDVSDDGQPLKKRTLVDEGSSVRGALKGWSKHGASRESLWKKMGMPAATNKPGEDWWLDAVTRPMGAYYRIAPQNIRDMHIALAEAGAIYGSAFTHSGWDSLIDHPENGAPTSIELLPIIPHGRSARDQGHAFAIVGYTRHGFIIQNSWGTKWGRTGFAILSYDDWLENAMDCWVVQLGVVTLDHQAVAESPGLRTDKVGRVKISRNPTLADHEISPYIINMENNGKLSSRGRFRTNEDDVRLLVEHQLVEACKQWRLGSNDPLHVAIYAHGGLNDEDAAAVAARNWIPHLYSKQIFPIFMMWETGMWKTFNNILQEAVFGDEEKAAGGRWGNLRQRIEEWRDERLEGLARWPGSKLWDEMKENARLISENEHSGARKLFKVFDNSAARKMLPKNIRLHLIGHSAGAIVHTFLAPKAIEAKLVVESISLMAPAVRMDTFQGQLGRTISDRKIRVLLVNLTDAAERSDDTCKPYGHSLLYLVSRAFEKPEPTPLLGMERYVIPTLPTVDWSSHVDYLPSPGGTWGAGCGVTRASSHGGMDDDDAVREAVASFIKFGSRKNQA